RIVSCLDSEIRNAFCTLASRPQLPNLVRELGCREPTSPGLGFTSTYTAGSDWFALFRKNDPGVPAGTLWARARSWQAAASPANAKPLRSVWAGCPESKHCGSSAVV